MSGNVSKNQVITHGPLPPQNSPSNTLASLGPGGWGERGNGRCREWKVQARMDTYIALFYPPCLWEKKNKEWYGFF